MNGYATAFVEVATEKLLIYALGRGMDYQDMPMVRAVAREASAQEQSVLGTRTRGREEQTRSSGT